MQHDVVLVYSTPCGSYRHGIIDPSAKFFGVLKGHYFLGNFMGGIWFLARTATFRKLNIYLLLKEKAYRRSRYS